MRVPSTDFGALAALLVLGLQLLAPGLPCLGLRRHESGKLCQLRLQGLPPGATSDLLGGKNRSRLLQTLHSRSIDQNLKTLLAQRLGQSSVRDSIRSPLLQ